MALPVPVPAIRLDATAWLHGFGGLRDAAARPSARRVSDWDRFAIIACALIGVICGGAQAKGWIHAPFDARFYWEADLTYPGLGAYVYPPPLAQLLALFHPIGWPLFIVGWTTLLFTCIGYLLGRWAFVGIGAGVAALATPFGVSWVLGPALVGNVTLVMAAAIVLGMRHPAVWAVPLVTKMTVGVGVLWFAFRGEWRSFAIAIGATLVVVMLSALVAPDAWLAFTRFALANVGATENGVPIVGPPLWVRLPIAVIVVAWGARTDRPWVVPIACGLALAGLYGLGSIVTIAVGSVALARWSDRASDRERRPRFASNAPRSVATVGAQVANS